MINRRLMIEVDIENIADRYIRQTVGEEVRRAWRLEDAASELLDKLDPVTAKVYEAQIQKINEELRKQK